MTGPARPRVVVVAAGPPALGGIATFARLLVEDSAVAAVADVRLLNTTRAAVRAGGRLTVGNVVHTVQDVVRIARAARGADVVHLQAAPGRLLPLLRMYVACAAARAGGARVLCHVHSSRINGGNPDGFRPGRAYRFVLARTGFVDAFLTVSRTGAEVLRRLVAPGSLVEHLDNAVDVAAQPRAAADAEPVTLLFVGTLSRRKGAAELAAAAGELRRQVPDGWSLVVVGGAAEVGEVEAAQMREAFAAQGLAGSVVGPRSAAEVRELMAGAGALVLPSHWEGQPITILEAMACGLPVVSTTVGAIPEVVRDGFDGLLVPPGDVPALTAALRLLVEQPALRRRLGESGRRRAEERYDTAVLADRLRPYYTARSRARRPVRR
jgi:glycosyltransferase involved in cell wall biosynthesis